MTIFKEGTIPGYPEVKDTVVYKSAITLHTSYKFKDFLKHPCHHLATNPDIQTYTHA